MISAIISSKLWSDPIVIAALWLYEVGFAKLSVRLVKMEGCFFEFLLKARGIVMFVAPKTVGCFVVSSWKGVDRPLVACVNANVGVECLFGVFSLEEQMSITGEAMDRRCSSRSLCVFVIFLLYMGRLVAR